MHNFEYFAPSTLKEAVSLLREPQTEALAGGTDLLGQLKRKIRSPRRLVNLKFIPELKGIAYDGELTIPAATHLSELERNPDVFEKFPILNQALDVLGTPQLRDMGTIGGNLCQHPRCWYFRNPLFPCWLKGGKICFAVNGENKYHAILGRSMCHSVHPSDLAPALIALDARVQITGPEGDRAMDLEEIYGEPRPDRRRTITLSPGELIAGIEVPPPPAGARGIYRKSMERKGWAFALVSLAAQAAFEGERVKQVRLVLGGVATIPWRAKKAEDMLAGERLSEQIIDSAANEVLSGQKSLQENGYKKQLVNALIRQALIFFLKGTEI